MGNNLHEDEMPLAIDLQVIVRTPLNGVMSCETFVGLAMPNPMLIEFCHVGSTESRLSMESLSAALLSELKVTARATQVSAPCPPGCQTCHAMFEPDCHKLLVLVGDSTHPASPHRSPLSGWIGQDPTFSILPILPTAARKQSLALLPHPIDRINAVFWNTDVEEALPALLQAGAITAAQSRIFISYRQTDTATAAIQLFDALSHDAFDVFLDHFRIPPGVDLQARLQQELGDKALLLLLESPNLSQSPWVAFEVAQARACGIGLVALNFSGSPANTGIDPALRFRLSPADLRGDGGIGATALVAVRDFVRREHDRALVRRRIALEQSFEQAILMAGGTQPQRLSNGSFRIVTAGGEYAAWLTPRPPDLPDYHRAHSSNVPPIRNVIIGITQLMELSRRQQHEWLAGISGTALVDEGLIAAAAQRIVGGTL